MPHRVNTYSIAMPTNRLLLAFVSLVVQIKGQDKVTCALVCDFTYQ